MPASSSSAKSKRSASAKKGWETRRKKLLLLEGREEVPVVEHDAMALIDAVKSRNISLVKELLECDSLDANAEDHIHRSAVEWAVYAAEFDIVHLLLKKVANLNVNRALLVAASCGYEDIVDVILNEAIDVDVNTRDSEGNTALICAIRNNREGTDVLAIVDMLTKKEELNVTILNKYGDSALIQAVRARNFDLVNAVLNHHSNSGENSYDFICHKDVHGVCAFIWALHCGCLEIADLIASKREELAAKQLSPSLLSPHTTHYGKSVLTCAMVELLWDRYKEMDDFSDHDARIACEAPNHPSGGSSGVYSWNFLVCSRVFNKYIVDNLLTQEDLCVNKMDVHGNSALTWAMKYKNDRIVEILLSREDVMINRLDASEQTPLILACRNGYAHYVEMLLDSDNLILNAKDPSGKTAIQWAVENNHLDCVTCLIRSHGIYLDDIFRTAVEKNDEKLLSFLLKSLRRRGYSSDHLVLAMLQHGRALQNKGNCCVEAINLLQQDCMDRKLDIPPLSSLVEKQSDSKRSKDTTTLKWMLAFVVICLALLMIFLIHLVNARDETTTV